MKPPRFSYHAPTSTSEALVLLAQHDGEAKLLAGGQSLVPLLNFRLARPAALIDLNGLGGLDTITCDPGTGELVLGPMVRHADAHRAALVQQVCPLLVEALGHVGHRAIRNRGTLGGSIAHADPSAEIPLVLVALEGRLKLASVRGERWVTAGEFFLSYLLTALEADEMLVEIRFPARQAPGAGWGFAEFSRRRGDFGLALAAALLDLEPSGKVCDGSLTIGGGGPIPTRSPAIQALVGVVPDDGAIRAVAKAAAAGLEYEADLHASAPYRQELVAVVAEQALQAAVASARRTL